MIGVIDDEKTSDFAQPRVEPFDGQRLREWFAWCAVFARYRIGGVHAFMLVETGFFTLNRILPAKGCRSTQRLNVVDPIWTWVLPVEDFVSVFHCVAPASLFFSLLVFGFARVLGTVALDTPRQDTKAWFEAR